MNDKAFTLAEILITASVMAAITAISIPSYVSMMSQARKEEARTNLSIMLLGEKNFRLKSPTGSFWCPGNVTGLTAADRLNTINTTLQTDIINWQYYTDNVNINCDNGRVAIRLEKTGNDTNYFCLDWSNSSSSYRIRDRGTDSDCAA
jgi:Tfp pilus assembly protein PilE